MTAATETIQGGESYRKQVLFTRYANGELTLDQVVAEVATVQPPRRPMSLPYRIVGAGVAFLIAFLTPTWARDRA